MLNNIDFINLVLDGFYLRVIFILIAIVASAKIIGLDKIFFLKKYIDKSFFSIAKLTYWLVAFSSLIYFKSLIEKNHDSFLTQVFEEHFLFASLVFFALFIVVLDAFIYMLTSVSNAKKMKNEIAKAKKFKQLSSIASVSSFFIPGGIWVKLALFGGSRALNEYVDTEIKNTLSQKTKEIISNMIKIVSINLFVILGTIHVA